MYAAGTVAAMIYNANRRKDDQAISPEDFVPNYKPPEPEEEVEDCDLEALKAFFGIEAPPDKSILKREK